jgi:hypothetical protein
MYCFVKFFVNEPGPSVSRLVQVFNFQSILTDWRLQQRTLAVCVPMSDELQLVVSNQQVRHSYA